jgi:hypothetical protein
MIGIEKRKKSRTYVKQWVKQIQDFFFLNQPKALHVSLSAKIVCATTAG